MDYLLIIVTAFAASLLTFFSGFGLGTILTPVFVLFFPVEIAITLTAMVHFLNNLFKLSLTFKNINREIVLKFGITSVLAAIAGALALDYLSHQNSIYTYTLLEKVYTITPVKLLIGLLLIGFSLFEIIPALSKIEFDKKYLPIGGLLSGFFGGLSGNQGALRSAFLIRTGLSKEVFIATGVSIACLIDVSRLIIYSKHFEKIAGNQSYIISATLAAFCGAYFGNKLLKKITLQFMQTIVAILLFVFALLLMAGVI